MRNINGRKKKVKQVLWGDWLSIEERSDDGWAMVRCGKQERYWIKPLRRRQAATSMR